MWLQLDDFSLSLPLRSRIYILVEESVQVLLCVNALWQTTFGTTRIKATTTRTGAQFTATSIHSRECLSPNWYGVEWDIEPCLSKQHSADSWEWCFFKGKKKQNGIAEGQLEMSSEEKPRDLYSLSKWNRSTVRAVLMTGQAMTMTQLKHQPSHQQANYNGWTYTLFIFNHFNIITARVLMLIEVKWKPHISLKNVRQQQT